MEYFSNKVFTSIEVDKDKDEIIFTPSEGKKIKMHHVQDCCESVTIESISGDIDDLLNTPILLAEERTKEDESDWGTETYTFYTFRTIKGTVDIRWYGSSNGYYSESVDISIEGDWYYDYDW